MYVSRTMESAFATRRKAYTLIAVVGPRQAGKTTFLKEQGKTQKVSYLLFDDQDIRTMFNEDVKKFERQFLDGYDLAILDEVQNCSDAGSKLKYLADGGRTLWLTSSSEIMLSKEILSYLVGRVSILRLYPFSLAEFLATKNQRELTPLIIKRSVWEHALYGGYPKVVLAEEAGLKQIILGDLYETMLLKDVAKNFAITDIRALENLTRYLAYNSGAILSYHSVSTVLTITFPTLKKYLDALEKSYLIIRIPPYATNKNKELSKQPKVYFIDTGLRNVIAKSFPAELDGPLFENYILCELLKAGLFPKYWHTKTHAEVDFIIEKGRDIIPIEVKLTADLENIGRSLRSFIELYHPTRAIVVNYAGIIHQRQIQSCQVMITDVVGMLRELRE